MNMPHVGVEPEPYPEPEPKPEPDCQQLNNELIH